MKKSGRIKKFVIFDLDGTLLDTIDDLTDGVNHALEKFGYPPRTVAEVTAFVGNGIGKLIARALRGGVKNPDYDRVLGEFREFYSENCAVKTKPYPGIPELLGALKERGIVSAVVSNKNDRAVGRLKEKYFNDDVALAVGEREGIKRKPAPDSVLEVLRLVGARPDEALYVGDSEVDVLTAANAGIDLVAVDWGFRPRETLIKSGADIIISKPEDLLDYIT